MRDWCAKSFLGPLTLTNRMLTCWQGSFKFSLNVPSSLHSNIEFRAKGWGRVACTASSMSVVTCHEVDKHGTKVQVQVSLCVWLSSNGPHRSPLGYLFRLDVVVLLGNDSHPKMCPSTSFSLPLNTSAEKWRWQHRPTHPSHRHLRCENMINSDKQTSNYGKNKKNILVPLVP